VVVTCLASILCSASRLQKGNSPETETEFAVRVLDLAVMVWGIAYFLGSLESPEAAGRITEFVFFGSIPPVPMALEWVSILLIFVSSVFLSWRFVGRHWPSAFLFLAAILAAMILGEGIARFQAIYFPKTQGFPTSSHRAWHYRYVRLNPQGFRDRDHARTPPDGIYRLLVIGDSYAFGEGIENIGSRFGEMLGEHLGKYSGKPWEVITAARSDTHTLDHLAFLNQTIDYKPDVIILEYVFNDIEYLAPVMIRDPMAERTPGMLSRLRLKRALFLNSLLYQQIYIRMRHLAHNAGEMQMEKIGPYEDVPVLQRHMKDLRRLADMAGASGAIFALVPFDLSVAILESSRRRYELFRENAADAGLRVWPIDNAFIGQDYSTLVVNSMDHHPNRKANLLAAEAVYPKILLNLTPQ